MTQRVPLDLLFAQILVQHTVSVRQRMCKIDLFWALSELVCEFYLVQTVGTEVIRILILDVGDV